MSHNQAQDQTQFAAEEPLFQSKVNVKVGDEVGMLTIQSAKVHQKRLLVWLLFAIGIVLISVLLLLFKTHRPDILTTTPLFSPDQATLDQKNEPFVQKIKQLKSQLELADPTQEELVFPPVDLSIKVVEK